MPGFMQNVSFGGQPSDYALQLQDLERRRVLAQALQQQGLQPMGNTEVIGGWAIPRSPMEDIGKMAQQISGAYQQNQLNKREQQLAKDYQVNVANTYARALRAGTGIPERPAQLDPQEIEQQADQGTPTPPNIPGQAPDRGKMAQILMENPQLAPMGMQLGLQDANRQALIAALGGGQGNAQPATPQATGGAPGAPGAPAAASPTVGGPAGGIPMAAWLQADPSGKAYMEQVAKDLAESKKLTRFSAGGGVINQAGKVIVSAPDASGRYTTYGENGPSISLAPGALEAQQATGQTPLQPVTNSDQTISYVPKAQLAAAANANPIPGGAPNAPQPVGTNLGNMRPPGQSTGFQAPLPPDQDFARIDKQLQIYGQRGVNTLQKIISTWAPPTENNTPALVTAAARRLGVDPNQPLDMNNPAVRHVLSSAIIQQEQGARLFAPSAVTQPGPPRFGQTQSQQIEQARQTAAGKATDEQFAKDYVQFTTGGAQDAMKQLAQLQDVMTELNKPGANLSGPVIGSIPDSVLKFQNPNAIAMRERVEEVVQRSLRAILGAQFTEKEGERLIARAYNPNQPEKENSIRVNRLMTQLGQAFENKKSAAEYFQQNGTLQGWQGKLPSISDFDPEGSLSKPIRSPGIGPKAAAPQDIVDELRRRGVIK